MGETLDLGTGGERHREVLAPISIPCAFVTGDLAYADYGWLCAAGLLNDALADPFSLCIASGSRFRIMELCLRIDHFLSWTS